MACLEVILGAGGVLAVHRAYQPAHPVGDPGAKQRDGAQGVRDVGVQQRCHLAWRQRRRLAHDGCPAGNAPQGLHLRRVWLRSAAGSVRSVSKGLPQVHLCARCARG